MMKAAIPPFFEKGGRGIFTSLKKQKAH